VGQGIFADLWNPSESDRWSSSDLESRIYSARLLGAAEPDLGSSIGRAASVKILEKNLFGQVSELLFVQAAGTDFAELEVDQFVPLRRDHLLRLLRLSDLSEQELARQLRLASNEPSSAVPTTNALLHAIIPAKYVDQTGADAILSLTNTSRAADLIQAVFGESVILIPYSQSDFGLAKAVAEALENRYTDKLIGLVLAKRGICTFGQTSEESYKRMLSLVNAAEERIRKSLTPARVTRSNARGSFPRTEVVQLRRQVSEYAGRPMILASHQSDLLPELMARPDAFVLVNRGSASPEHHRYFKVPHLVGRDIQALGRRYQADFLGQTRNAGRERDLTPRVILDPTLGLVTVGREPAEADFLAEIFRHTIKIILQAEELGGWQPISEFDLSPAATENSPQTGSAEEFAGEVALITGAASGIGRATAKTFLAKGAAVVGLDLNPSISALADVPGFLGLPVDVTDEKQISYVLNQTVQRFGGLDILILNTGYIPSTRKIVDLEPSAWQHAMRVNLDANFNLLRNCYSLLQESPGGGRIAVISPQNVAPRGGGAAAYSAAKAALTQLVRSAAAEWGASRIRVQIVHPHAVFDTGIWTPEILSQRARARGMTVDDYRRDNFLRTEISSRDVAELVAAICGSAFKKTTGAQIPIDGGCDRAF
jgi:rhamnose utilization protein RhaD (predicted bifunctional aldolase and dehydrogenase)/NAD(P)-dependent dehydrogenase (short-subunit alcohol dehydrogenase family)